MRILPLVGLMAVAWLLIIGEVYVFFYLILEYAPPIHEVGALTALALLKVAATLALGGVWFVVMSSLSKAYTNSKLRNRTPKPSS
ncbi:MAG: hypothetical protein HY297_04190 [Thaumarchaeota archaeon]|nr:hypothetical protein [Nitrososphaerota archaeon]